MGRDLVVAVLTTVIASVGFTYIPALRVPDEYIYARRFPTRDAVSSDIRIIEIAESTVRQLGQLPLDRMMYADVLGRLAQQGKSVIGVDLLFDQPLSEPGDTALAEAARRYHNIVFARVLWPLEGDVKAMKAEAHQQGGPSEYFMSGPLGDLFYPALLLARPTRAISWIEPSSSFSPIGAVAFDSHYHSQFRDPVLPEGVWMEAFPIKLFQLFEGSGTTPPGASAEGDPRIPFARQERLYWPQHPLSFTRWPKIAINYAGDAASFQRISFEEVVGNADVSWARGKIVILGAALPSAGVATPLSLFAGGYTAPTIVWANAVNTLMTRQYIRALDPVLIHVVLGGYTLLLLIVCVRARSMTHAIVFALGGVIAVATIVEVAFALCRFQMVVGPFLGSSLLIVLYVQAARRILARRIIAR